MSIVQRTFIPTKQVDKAPPSHKSRTKFLRKPSSVYSLFAKASDKVSTTSLAKNDHNIKAVSNTPATSFEDIKNVKSSEQHHDVYLQTTSRPDVGSKISENMVQSTPETSAENISSKEAPELLSAKMSMETSSEQEDDTESNQEITVEQVRGAEITQVQYESSFDDDDENDEAADDFFSVSSSKNSLPSYEHQFIGLSPPSFEYLEQSNQIDHFQHNLFFKSDAEVEFISESNIVKDLHLPEYRPATYKLCVTLVKFEKSQIADISSDISINNSLLDKKQWQLVIMELNSTQLNLYHLNLDQFNQDDVNYTDESQLVEKMANDRKAYYNDKEFAKCFYDHDYIKFKNVDVFKAMDLNEGILPIGTGSQHCLFYNRYHGSREKSRLKLKLEQSTKKPTFFSTDSLDGNSGSNIGGSFVKGKKKRKFSLSSSNSAASVEPMPSFKIINLNTYAIMKEIIKRPDQFMNDSKLIKSFSMQYGKIGIANDFIAGKKDFQQISAFYGSQHYPNIDINPNNALRLRLEAYQFLIDFKYLNELINWYNYIVHGIDISLDLQLREMPKFNNVPSRRRRRRMRRLSRRRSNTATRGVAGENSNNKSKEKAKKMRNRALSSASEILSRSRRGTVTSNTSLEYETEGNAISNSGVCDSSRQRSINNIRAKGNPLMNYLLTEFEPSISKEQVQSSFHENDSAEVSQLSVKLGKTKVDSIGFLGNSRERSNSVNKLNIARSPQLYQNNDESATKVRVNRDRSSSLSSGITLDSMLHGDNLRYRSGSVTSMSPKSDMSVEKMFGFNRDKDGKFTNLEEVLVRADSAQNFRCLDPGISERGSDNDKDIDREDVNNNNVSEDNDDADNELGVFENDVTAQAESSNNIENDMDELDDDDDDDDDDEFDDNNTGGRDAKYNEDRVINQKRIVKDAIRSMCVLRSTDTWINNRLVREIKTTHIFSGNGFLRKKNTIEKKKTGYRYFMVGMNGLILINSDV